MSESAKRQQAVPLVVAVCGVKNSGKTTCVEQIVKGLTERGYRIAVLKHDGHDFTADVPGTDSFRMQQAGACGTAVFSENRVLIYREKRTAWEELINCFSESDLILAEGCKDTELLKFEIVRNGISREPVSNAKGRVGILTDIPGFSWGREQIWDLNNMAALTDWLETKIREECPAETGQE